MDVKEVYKMTEVGVIPQDWNVDSIDGIFHIVNNTVESSKYNVEHYVSTENILQNKAGIVPYLSTLAYSRAKEYVVDDILLSNIRPYLKKIWLSTRSGCCSSDVIVFRSKCGVLPNYAYYLLAEDKFFAYATETAKGTKMPRGDKASILKYQVCFPKDLAEQTSIVNALSDIDSLITSLDKLIAKKINIKQGAMQNLLTGKIRLDGYIDEWVEKKLGDCSDLYQPKTIGQNLFTEFGYLVYGANGVIGRYSQYNHETDQVLVACRGNTCGVVNYSKGKCWINGNAMVVNVDNYDVDKKFMYYLLTYLDLSSLITGSGQPQIVRGPMEIFEIVIPKDKDEQTAIATILSDMDKEIESLQQKRDKYIAIKEGMMQQLLTGKIRLV